MSQINNWTISKLDCYPNVDGEKDVVFCVHYRLDGEQVSGGEVFTDSVYGTASLTLDPTQPYTPYDQLTQQQVLDWIWANGVNKDAAEAAVASQIADQINPKVVSLPLPWQTAALEQLND